ncbi:MAG TPA: C40 family peptidase [Gallionellaceae bacterium]|nr:C40 family peptidase [Gallionellaceae bacterium]
MDKFLLPILLAILSACSSAPARTAHASHAPATEHPASAAMDSDADMNDVAVYALSLSDTPYRYGGNTPESGFDCSGFVRHVYKHTLGLSLPRTSHEMSRVGEPQKVSRLQPGDLVFYNTRHQSYSHVGIYLGEGKFVHSPRAGSSVRVENMNESYWLARYNGARRLIP